MEEKKVGDKCMVYNIYIRVLEFQTEASTDCSLAVESRRDLETILLCL